MKGDQAAVCPLRRFKFFRVMLPGFSRRLPLPRAFTKYFIQENNTWATLLSPLGKSWHVRVWRDGNTLNFEGGWEKFAEEHKLAMGDFLVFKHKGSLVFHVTIFDPTTCERQYHSTVGLTSTITNDKIPGQEKAPKEEELSANFEEVTNACGYFEHAGSRRQETSCGKRAAEPMESAVTSTKCRSIDAEEFKEQRHDLKAPDVMEAAPRGPQFEAVLRLSHKTTYVEIPAAFAASNKLCSVSRLFLKDPKGVVWRTNVNHWRVGSHRMRSRISWGWRRFCAANNLKDGDICVFELRERNTLHVQAREKLSLQTYRRRKFGPMKALEDVRMRNKKPIYTAEVIEPATVHDHTPLPCGGFTSKITPSEARRGYLLIPWKFRVLFAGFSTVHQFILVDGQSQKWPAIVWHGKKSARIGTAWRAFCHCNNVEAGDVCNFKLTSREQRELVFHVEVIKTLSHPPCGC